MTDTKALTELIWRNDPFEMQYLGFTKETLKARIEELEKNDPERLVKRLKLVLATAVYESDRTEAESFLKQLSENPEM